MADENKARATYTPGDERLEERRRRLGLMLRFLGGCVFTHAGCV